MFRTLWCAFWFGLFMTWTGEHFRIGDMLFGVIFLFASILMFILFARAVNYWSYKKYLERKSWIDQSKP